MLHLGLTGNIASGKSAVASLLEGLGATVIDADVLARDAVAPGTAGYAAILAHFGPAIIAPDGSIDRAALRRRVFANALERDALNAIVHPAVSALRDHAVTEARARGDCVVVSDIPLLFEVGLEHAFDGIILVDAPVALRRERLQRDRGLPLNEAQAMIDAQWPSDRKRPQATWVIDNDRSRDQLAVRVAEIWRSIQGRMQGQATLSSVPPTSPPTFSEHHVSNIPADLRYTKEHEYVRVTGDASVVAIGITDFAQGELGDIVYVELPKVGTTYKSHDVFGTVEAVKAVSELYMPVAGEVVAVNDRIDGEPALINTDPFGDGWMIKVRIEQGSDAALLSSTQYTALLGG